jgi:ribonuclease Z
MEILFLGTSAGIPTKKRNVSSIVIRRGGEYLFIDVGEGTQRQAVKAGIGIRRNMKIIISHLHGDHVLGLIPMLQTLCLFKRDIPLDIYGPRGIKQFLNINMSLLDIEPEFMINIHYLSDGSIYDMGEYTLHAIKNEHCKYSYSIAIVEKPRPGKFNPEKASKDRIPVEYWGRLKKGEDIEINGKIYYAKNYVSPPYRGRKIVISGDTRPFRKMIKFSKEADVLIHEATFANDKIDRSIETKHTTAIEAAKIAKAANVKVLILTHFSARYEDASILVEEARKIFPAVFAAEDFMRIEVPLPKKHLESSYPHGY